MMFKKGLGCELSGFQVPNVPRAPRSIRRTTLHRQTVEDGEACAFEVLASLAGKLLQEGESSDSSNASEALGQPATGKDVFKPERQFDKKPMKTECVDQGSSEASIVGFDSATESSIDPKVSPHDEYNAFNEQPSANKNFSRLHNLSSGLKSCKGKAVFDKCLTKLEGGSCNVKTEDRSEMDQDTEGFGLAVLTMRSNDCFSKDTSRDSGVAPAPFNLGRDYKLQLCRDHFRNASFPRHRKDSKLGIRDDDEKFSRSSRLSNRYKASRPPQCIGERRIRKLLASKYWKAAPKLKDYEVTGADGQTMPLYQKRKSCFSHERSQYAAVHKKRKFYNQGSVLSSEGGLSSESVSNSPEKDVSRSVPSLLMEEDVVLTGDQAPQTAKDSHVKLSIKSFRIPELFIEVPETATVGSLKRTVMEAVTALLGGGVCVGLLLEGKKVRDDGRTLNQTGISCKDDLNTVGFTLEPNPAQAPPPLRAEDHPLPLSCDATHDPTRSETSPVDSEIPDVLTDPLELNNTVKHMDSNHDVVSSSTDLLTDQSESGSKALVPVPPMNVGALSVVPLSQQKPKKSELAPRRTRRPFSVSEVEALVQAVEELGTGRWRDVKLQAFEDAEHRTYVDLKDKWKTLVHTARISPQQRRGEPVPQELLNRVLAAHAYWSEHQTKQQSKHLSGRTMLEICN